jgi:4-hydroxy-3-polyprenylbenzoate decarboxylase
MSNRDITDKRGLLEFLKGRDDFVTIDKEVDPIYEVSGLIKALEGGPTIYCTNIKGFPGHRVLTNTFSTREKIAATFGAEDKTKVKHKCLDAIQNQIPYEIVDNGPCQENVITENIDVKATIPIIKHTDQDAGRLLGAITFVSEGIKGTHLSYNRSNFRGKDYSSLSLNLGTHFEHHLLKVRQTKGKLPITINISPPPAVEAMAAGGFTPITLPVGMDEMAIAGGLQGSPVKICKAKTVDTYSVANSEYVIEGYVDTTQTVWESEKAEETGEAGIHPYFPEYTSYLGRAYKTFKFQATAITHRNNPIFDSPPAHCIHAHNIGIDFKEAAILDICNRMAPGLVVDINMPSAFRGMDGVVVQVNKRRRRDEGYQRNLINGIWAGSTATRMVIVVDTDINIYNTDDVLWAMNTRVNPNTDIITLSEARGIGTGPREKEGSKLEQTGLAGNVAFDATVPYHLKWRYIRGSHPKVDLSKWLSADQIEKARSLQNEFAKDMANRRI